MKPLLKLSILLMCIALHCSLQGCKMKEKDSPLESNIQEELYYGLTANEILKMSDEESLSFIKEKDIDVADWIILKNNLLEKKYLRDAEKKKQETKEIYDKIDKDLGVK
tara:strand:+ start:119 stop:445 length:327 start_codon:yes stop_codon:yes gene_type:complete